MFLQSNVLFIHNKIHLYTGFVICGDVELWNAHLTYHQLRLDESDSSLCGKYIPLSWFMVRPHDRKYLSVKVLTSMRCSKTMEQV